MNPSVIIGVIPAFWLSLIVTLSNAGICEYKTKDGGRCRYEWGSVLLVMGLGGAFKGGMKMFEVGYNTFNPELHAPATALSRREEELIEPMSEPDVVPPAGPPLDPPTEEPALDPELAEAMPEPTGDARRDDPIEPLSTRMEKAYQKINHKNNRA